MPARYHRQLLLVEDDAVVLGLEPLHGVLLAQPVLRADPAGLAAPVADIEAGSTHHDVEVHAVDADAGVVLDAQVDVLLDAEPEVAVIGEVAPLQLVLLHLEAPLQDLLGLGPPDGAVDGDLLVPPDAEAPDGVPRLGEDGGLPGEGLQHLAGAGQSVTGLSHADVQAQLPDLQLPHGVLGLVSAHSGSERVMFQQQWSHIASVFDDLNRT